MLAAPQPMVGPLIQPQAKASLHHFVERLGLQLERSDDLHEIGDACYLQRREAPAQVGHVVRREMRHLVIVRSEYSVSADRVKG